MTDPAAASGDAPASDRLELACGLWLETGDLLEVRRRFPDVADQVEQLAETRRVVEALTSPFGGSVAPPSIPGYRIVRPIGRGAFSIVYEAEQISLRRRVALKVLAQSPLVDPKAAERFRREAFAVASLRHPAIVTVHDHGEAAGTFYIAMELSGDRSLAEDIARERAAANGPPRRGRPEFTRLARGFADLADALAHAHAHELLHRDVKPSNVLVADDGSLRLADFGLASLCGSEQLTLSGQPIGSPQTMAPEQACGDRAAIGPWSDVYGLGATLYEALTWEPAFPGRGVAEVVAAVLAGRFAAPRTIDPGIPRELEAIVLKCLEHDPRLRYASAGDLAADLRAFADDLPVGACRMRPLARALSFTRRRPLALAAVVVLAIAAPAVLAVVDRARRAERDRAAAERQRENAESRTLALDERLRGRELQDRILALLSSAYRLDTVDRPDLRQELAAIDTERAGFRNDPGLQVLYAYALWCLQRTEDAVAVLEQAPDARQLVEGRILGILLPAPGGEAAALELWRAAERGGIRSPLACFLASQYLIRFDPLGAMEHLERGRSCASIGMHFFISIHQSLVEARSRLGLLDEALRDVQLVHRTQGDDPRTLACRASLLERLGRTQEAEGFRARAEEVIGDRDQMRVQVCQLLLNLEDPTAAESMLGPEAASDHGPAWYRIALECRLHGPPQPDDAALAKEAARRARGDARVLVGAARLLMARRDPACLKLLERVVEGGGARAFTLLCIARGLVAESCTEESYVTEGLARGLPAFELARGLALWRLLRGETLAQVEELLARGSEYAPLFPPLAIQPADAARGPAAALGTLDLAALPARERDRRVFGVLDHLARNSNRFPAVMAAREQALRRVRQP